MPPCVYCGRDAGEHDEHEECVVESAEEELELRIELDAAAERELAGEG